MKRTIFTTVFLLVMVFAGQALLARNYYLDPDGSGDGSSWAQAAPSWSALVGNQTLADGDIIYCAVGTFDQADGTGSEIEITNSLTIIGGQQNPENPSAETETIFQVEIPGTSAYRVFDITGSSTSVSISNMTIKGGDFSYKGGHKSGRPIVDSGGCIRVSEGTLTLDNVTIQDGNAYNGGGIDVYSASLTITNSVICNNQAIAQGAGIYCENSNLSMSNTTLTNNLADYDGGGLCVDDCSTTIKNSTIANNHCDNDNSGNYNGGGVSIISAPVFDISNTIIANNYKGNVTTTGDDFYRNESSFRDNGYNVVEFCNKPAWVCFNNRTSILYNTKWGTTSTSEEAWTQGGVAVAGDLNLSTTLANNGGPAQTLAFTGESFAAASATTGIPYGSSPYWNDSPETDQRGVARFANANTAIGAYAPNYYAELTWLGTTDDWNTAANWSPEVIPGEGSNVTIPASITTSFPVIGFGDNATCNNLTLEADASLTIESDENGTGSLITNGTITNNGTVDIKQFVTFDAWHLFAAPNNVTTANSFAGEYLQAWDETTTTWTDIVDPVTPIEAKRGYSLWVESEETDGPPPLGKTFTFTGTPNTGNQSIDVTYTINKGDDTYFGANLLGNPYPSSIDWSGLDDTWGAVYYYNGLAYVSWNNGSGTGSQYVPPMQGFFMVVNAAGTFELTNDDREHSSTAYYKGVKSNSIVLETTSKDYADKLYFSFDLAATEGFDLKHDAHKFMSGTEGLSELFSYTGGKRLSIDVRPAAEEIQLGFHNSEAGIYNIGISEIADITEATLEDTKTETFHDLINGNYEFVWDVTDNEKRFKLHLNAVGIEESHISESNILIYAANNQIFIKGAENGQVVISDIMGRVLHQQEISGSGLNSIPVNFKTGVYVVMVQSGTEVKTEKIFIK